MGSPTLDDEAWVGRRLAAARRRAADRPDAGARHQHAAFRLGWRELDDLRRIDAPALVIHGTADRVLPVAHADALAAGIANSELHVIDGMGHLPTRAEWILIAAAASAFFHEADDAAYSRLGHDVHIAASSSGVTTALRDSVQGEVPIGTPTVQAPFHPHSALRDNDVPHATLQSNLAPA